VSDDANIAQVKDSLVAGRPMTAAQIDRLLAALDDGQLTLTTAMLVSAWGHRPGGVPTAPTAN
jgi:hypothetical protein